MNFRNLILFILILDTSAYSQNNYFLVKKGREVLTSIEKKDIDYIGAKTLVNKFEVKSLNNGLSASDISNEIIRVRKRRIEYFCEKLRRKEPLATCEANIVFKTSQTPDDTEFAQLYGMTKINAQSAWDLSTGSSSVKVGVVDTGIDYLHPDLSANVAINGSEVPGDGVDNDGNGYIDDYYGYNFSSSTNDPFDDNDHGTHVSGTIGAQGNNSLGVTGVNWSVSIVAAKALNSNGEGTLDAIASGIDYAVSRGVSVINLSIGASEGPRILRRSIINAKISDVLIAAAAGNESENNDKVFSFPANYDLSNVISVAATTSLDELASFSNHGIHTVSLAAPGSNILSTLPNNTYDYFSGTSMATPHVAGLAALIKSYKSLLSASDIKNVLLNSVDKIDALAPYVSTGGRINAYNALVYADTVNPSGPPAAGSDNVTISFQKSKIKNSKVSVTGSISDSEGAFVGDKVILYCNSKKKSSKTANYQGKFTFQVSKSTSKLKCIIKDLYGTNSKRFSI